MINHIDLNSLSEQNGQTVKRTGSQTQNELHKIDTFVNLTNTITEVSENIINEQGYMGEVEITNMWEITWDHNHKDLMLHIHTLIIFFIWCFLFKDIR